QGRFRIGGVLSLKVADPWIVGANAFHVGRFHRPIPDFESADIPGLCPPAIPAAGSIHCWVLLAAIGGHCIGVNGIDHAAPCIDVLLVAGDPERVVESDESARNAIAVLTPAGDGIHRTKAPPVSIAPPFAIGPTDLAVEIDKTRNYAVVAF